LTNLYPAALNDPTKYSFNITFVADIEIRIYSVDVLPTLTFKFTDKTGLIYTIQNEVIQNYTFDINELMCESWQCLSLPNFTKLSIYTYYGFVDSSELSICFIDTININSRTKLYVAGNTTSIVTYDYTFDLTNEIVDATTNIIITSIPFIAAIMLVGKLERKSLYLISGIYFIFGLNSWMNYLVGSFLFMFAYLMNKDSGVE
jgi:hypothetical protein